MAPRIDRIGTITTDLGESPLWAPDGRSLWFMDCRRGAIHRIDPERGEVATHVVPPPAGSFAFNADGRLVVALKESIGLLDPGSGELQALANIDDSHPNLRLNDGTAMPDGSFVVGTMHVSRADDEPPLGGLYRLAMDGTLRKLQRGFGVVNGPRVSPVDGRLYVCDSARRVIVSYVIDPDGGLSDGRTFVDTSSLGSAPDGCCFDTAGGLWTALVHGGALGRFDRDGRLSVRIAVPVAHPTALCFGGPTFEDLFVTSIRDSGRLRSDGPLDGALLRVRGVGYRGLPAPVCRIAG